MSRVATGVIGAGRIGQIHLRIIRDHVPQLQIVAVADESPAVRERVRHEFGYPVYTAAEAVFEDSSITAVLICSPTRSHAAHVVAAAQRDKHVFCEKPLASTVPEANECVAASDHSKGILQVGFNRRFDPNFDSVRTQVRNGDVGKPLIVRITSRDPEPPPVEYPRGPGGFYRDSIIHDFDMARFLLGEEVVEVASFGSSLCDPLSASSGDIDTAVTLLRFSSGAVAAIDNSRISAIGYDQRIEVHGTKGTVRADNVPTLSTVLWDSHGEHRSVIQYFITERYTEAYRRELMSFVAAIGGQPVAVTARDGLAAQELAELAHRSLIERRTVDVDAATGQRSDARLA